MAEKYYRGIPVPTNKIVVIGVGGGGGNAINNMVEDKFEGIDYVAINTDMQHLELSHADYVYAIGQKSAEGYGAGADPNRGEAAALEDEELIAAIVENSKLVILTAGFGKGTGTGATPVIARIAKNMKKLVVAVITTPFSFEGSRHRDNATRGISNLAKACDSYIIVDNDKLIDIAESSRTKLTSQDAFKHADDVLKQCILGISDIMINTQYLNIDFADLKTILGNMGRAYLGIGYGSDELRIRDAIEMARRIDLQDTRIQNAKSILLYVKARPEVGINEINLAAQKIKEDANPDLQLIFGFDFSENLGHDVEIMIIATGFDDPNRIAVIPKVDAPPQKAEAAPINQQARPKAREEAEVKKLPQDQPVEAQQNTLRPTIVSIDDDDDAPLWVNTSRKDQNQ
ncbi:MAG: cell division protein FtsZ [Clostridia bacterium]|nr:cell division protein FtsZ [Clostridia bacterium]